MSTEQDLRLRSPEHCELCGAPSQTDVYEVPPASDGTPDQCLLLCARCRGQLDRSDPPDPDHCRSVTDTMWSPVPAVQVMAWRVLRLFRSQAWAADALEMLYLDDEIRAWAESGDDGGSLGTTEGAPVHRDSNGVPLAAGDTVTLIKDLSVKGAGFTAKRGTAVRNISLVHDNPAHIEGRINGQQIVILTEFVKKSN